VLHGTSARDDWARLENPDRHLQHLDTSALHPTQGEKRCSDLPSRQESQRIASAHSEHLKSIRRT
jgi:hypothetical protein